VNIYLVRHGEAAAAWGASKDPGLSELGKQQAKRAAEQLLPSLDGNVNLVSSPLLRAQETAIPFAQALALDVSLNDSFREIPSPVPFEERQVWLREFMGQGWGQQPELLTSWRDHMHSQLLAMQKPTVIFTHFMVLNTMVGLLSGREETVCFRPDNASITQIKHNGDSLELVAQGDELETFIN
jgi:probable phosphoglycerate mutase